MPDTKFSVVAFYGFVPKEDTLAQFYWKSLKWFEEFQSPPNKIGTGLGKGLKVFRRVRKRIEANGFSLAGTKHIEIYSAPYDGKDPKNGRTLECAISAGKLIQCFVTVASSILTIGDPRLLEMAKELMGLLNPTYGVGFQRLASWGPSYFARGINYGDVPRDEENRVINFRETTWVKHYLQGRLGGVFPWNFLTRPQLIGRVGQLSLEEWIQAKGRRGNLQRVTDNMVLWSVPDEDIPDVYKALWEAEIVFDYERYMNSFVDDENVETTSPEQRLGEIMKHMGYQSTDEIQILKVEKPGELRKLSRGEKERILPRKGNVPKHK